MFRCVFPSGGDFRANKLRGVYVGIVTANQDQGNDSRYRVKLRFPWLPSDSNDSSAWARIVVPMAGAGRGTYFLPEVGAQVLVVFEHGNIGCPMVIGSLWSEAGRPPERNADGANHIRGIKSRRGHRLIFDDTPGAERVILADSSRKNSIVIDSASNIVAVQSVDGDIELLAPHGAVRLHGQHVTATTSDNIIAVGRTLRITSRGAINAKAGRDVRLQAMNVQLNPGGIPPNIPSAKATLQPNNSPAKGLSGSAALTIMPVTQPIPQQAPPPPQPAQQQQHCMTIGVNFPWGHWTRDGHSESSYGWDFGDSPYGRRLWVADITQRLTYLRSLGVQVIRWFIMADGFTYGGSAHAPRTPPRRRDPRFLDFDPPALSHDFISDFGDLLNACRQANVRLIPSLIDFHFCSTRRPQREGESWNDYGCGSIGTEGNEAVAIT